MPCAPGWYAVCAGLVCRGVVVGVWWAGIRVGVGVGVWGLGVGQGTLAVAGVP